MVGVERLRAGLRTQLAAQRREWQRRLRRYGYAWAVIRTDYLSMFGLVIILMLVVVAVLSSVISPYNPLSTDPLTTLAPPSWAHPFGTDAFGRDILSRTLAGFHLDLLIATSSVALAFGIGTVIGALSGYYGGYIDDVVMRCVDVIMSFPLLVVALGLVAFLGVGTFNVIIATVIVNVPIFARLMRAEVLARKALDFIAAAKTSGNSDLRIIFVHLFPNCSGPVIIQATLNLAWAILNVAALSFLGIGVRPPAPEWGVMVAEGAQYMTAGAWWLSFFPGVCIMLSVLAFNMFGDGVQDALDPRQHR